MARSGGFGGSLNPFGTGSMGSFSQYSIGDNLQDLARYKAEVAWGNGQLSDAAYLAVLADVVANTTPGSKEQATAQNSLDDAQYTIGRSTADAQGLDALIAFDQSSLAKMLPTNNKYRSVKNSLDSELASRRSRDYGKLVDQYNSGSLSTAVLTTWVQNTLGGLSPDAPDYSNWQGTLSDLRNRAQSEKDSQVYQDYQMGRMDAPAFLAYIKGRRDAYAPESPDYADWNRRLEDETKTATTNAQNAKDTAFFDQYNEGHVSDKEYLAYIKSRLDGMPADDPNREEWQHRYNTTSYSLAEDALRFAVSENKRPVSDLVAFYKAYQHTLNPGSAEWRSTQSKIDSLKGATGGSGGSSSGGGYTPTDATGSKVISPKFTLETAFSLLKLPANASKELVANFNLNYASLMNAYQRGDTEWQFFDPRHPGQSVMLPTSSDALARLDQSKIDYNTALATVAFGKGDNKGAYGFVQKAIEAADHQRGVNIQTARRNADSFLNALSDQVDQFSRLGDDASVFNTLTSAVAAIDDLLADPTLDDAARSRYEAKRQTYLDNPVMPVSDPLHPGQLISRAIDPGNSVFDANGNMVQAALAPGWHRVFDTSSTTGARQLKLVFDDGQAGAWEQSHLPININVGDRVVTAEGSVQTSSVPMQMTGVDDKGAPISFASGPAGMTVVYFDGQGNRKQAYSLDGVTWVTSDSGALPTLTLNSALTPTTNANGGTDYTDADGDVVATQDPTGAWKFDPKPGTITFYGQEQAQTYMANVMAGEAKSGYAYSSAAVLPTPYEAYAAGHDFGAPGQHMNLAVVGSDGSITQFNSDWQSPTQASDAEMAAIHQNALPITAAQKAYQAQTRVGAAKSGYAYSSGSLLPGAGNVSDPELAASIVGGALRVLGGLLAQLPPGAGKQMTGSGLASTPIVPAKSTAYQYSSATLRPITLVDKVTPVTKAVLPPIKPMNPLPIVKTPVTKETVVTPGTEYSKGYVYSSGSSKVAAAAPKPAAPKPVATGTRPKAL